MTYELSRKIGDAISAALIERNPMTTIELQEQFKLGVYEKARNYYSWERITEEYLKLAESFI